MCLAVPLQILRIDGREALCGHRGLEVRARVDLLEDAAVGDWVLVHAGFAIAVVDPAEAAEVWSLVGEVTGRGVG